MFHIIKIYILLGTSFAFTTVNAQNGLWTWMKGNDSTNAPPVRGTIGIADSANTPGGVYAMGYWTDTAGNFWIFGGLNISEGIASDLWKFDPLSLNWTCMRDTARLNIAAPKGVYDTANAPGAHGWGMFTWVTPDNHLWLFGGFGGYGGTYEGDHLWQYDPVINQWAWMGNFGPGAVYGVKGVPSSLNKPGGRCEGNACWVDDNGDLWLFGGETRGTSAEELSDMWRYQVSTGLWTWMSGPNFASDTGYYGVRGVPNITNHPPGRSTNVFWKDEAGNFWIYAGTDYLDYRWYQDIWMFNPHTTAWTWWGGPKGHNDFYFSATNNCELNGVNQEGRRFENRSFWQICEGLIVNFGGLHNFDDAYNSFHNDMWAIDVLSGRLSRVASAAFSNYGVQGVASSGNYPPRRAGAVGFKDGSNNLWLFGGLRSWNFYNDVWRYQWDTSCSVLSLCARQCNLTSPLISTSNNSICASDSAIVCAPTGFRFYQWNNGGTTQCITVNQAGNYYVTVSDNDGCTAESNHLYINVFPAPAISLIVNGDTLSTTGDFSSYQWYRNGLPVLNGNDQVLVASDAGAYSIEVTDSNGCKSYSNPFVINSLDDHLYGRVSIWPNPLTDYLHLSVDNNLIDSRCEIFDGGGRLVKKFSISSSSEEVFLSLTRGVYTLRITADHHIYYKRLVRL